jgi:hypothetical protein
MTTTTVLTKIKKPEPEKSITNDPFFRQLYIAAFGNLHSQFEQYSDDSEGFGLRVFYDGEDKESLERSKHMAGVAWNSACEAYELFQKHATIENFNSKVTHAE